MTRQTTKRTVRTAKRQRKDLSLPEVLLWQELRKSDLKFRRQHPIGPYVADFYCAKAKVVIEVDGIVHDMGNRPKKDAERDRFLESRQLHAVRIAASDVLADPNRVAEAVIAICEAKLD